MPRQRAARSFASADNVAALIDLPVTEALPALKQALAQTGRAVLVAPPGAGKTTLVPLALLDEKWLAGRRIVLLEPRRIAARAAASRMASLLGEEVGRTIGYVMRMDSRQSAATRVLVVTEGVFARMILDDPELTGIGAVLFDEFHERSLDADFGLALALDAASALRADLRILVMSATLDGARVARLLGDAPVIESKGRGFDVDIRHRERKGDERIEEAMAGAVRDMLRGDQGSVLAFLPGRAEIDRTAERLAGRLPDDVDMIALHGAMDMRDQDAAIRPAPPGRRKLVLATSIAETSVTIDGVRVVIDSGLSRLPKYEPATGLTRLETVRVSQASAAQRAGRAGRTAPGIAIRLWRAEQTAALPAFTPPEILETDLSGLLLDCAAWGVPDPRALAFLDPPPEAALAQARSTLRMLGALDKSGALTAAGRAMRALALPARLAAMVVKAAAHGAVNARNAAELAMLLTEQGLGGNAIDVEERLDAFRRDRGHRAQQARGLASGIARSALADAGAEDGNDILSAGTLLMAAWPDRVAMQRGGAGRFVLANGRGGVMAETERLARAPFLVVAALQGVAANARILAAAAIGEDDLRAHAADRIEVLDEAAVDAATGALRARRVERLGALLLSTKPLPQPKGADAQRLLIEAIRNSGLGVLPWGRESENLRARLAWLNATLGEPWPAMDDDALLASLDAWLEPYLAGAASMAALGDGKLREALMARVPWDLQREVDRLAPGHFEAPTGSRLPIRYGTDGPVLAVRVQELFGMKDHPSIGGGKVPLTLELLSPAHRTLQTTRDLPGFWKGSWTDVRADMRGRYPRHVWPDNPADAAPTARAKPRGT
jgi:ATP-dependent helicase HrpB